MFFYTRGKYFWYLLEKSKYPLLMPPPPLPIPAFEDKVYSVSPWIWIGTCENAYVTFVTRGQHFFFYIQIYIAFMYAFLLEVII